MKILHVIAYYKPAYVYGGPVYSVGSLCEGLSRCGHSVTVYTTLANGKEELDITPGRKYNVEGVDVTYFVRRTYDLSHYSPDLLRQLWKDVRRYDVIHISGWWNLVSVLGALVCLLRGVRPIVSLRGMLGPYSFQNGRVFIKRTLHLLIGKWLLSRSVLHATVAQELREVKLVTKCAEGFILPNFLELPPYVKFERKDNEYVKLIFLGRIHHKKNLELLFNVIAKVKCSWRLSILGTGEKTYVDSLIQLAAKLCISDRIDWLGHLNGNEKFVALSESDIMVLLSHAENFANTVVESLSVGTPVFLSGQVGMADYIARHDYGKVVKLNLNEAIVELNNLIEDKELLIRTFEKAPHDVRRDFSSDKLIESYLSEYQKYCQK